MDDYPARNVVLDQLKELSACEDAGIKTLLLDAEARFEKTMAFFRRV